MAETSDVSLAGAFTILNRRIAAECLNYGAASGNGSAMITLCQSVVGSLTIRGAQITELPISSTVISPSTFRRQFSVFDLVWTALNCHRPMAEYEEEAEPEEEDIKSPFSEAFGGERDSCQGANLADKNTGYHRLEILPAAMVPKSD
jgi:hypothetical protein